MKGNLQFGDFANRNDDYSQNSNGLSLDFQGGIKEGNKFRMENIDGGALRAKEKKKKGLHKGTYNMPVFVEKDSERAQTLNIFQKSTIQNNQILDEMKQAKNMEIKHSTEIDQIKLSQKVMEHKKEIQKKTGNQGKLYISQLWDKTFFDKVARSTGIQDLLDEMRRANWQSREEQYLLIKQILEKRHPELKIRNTEQILQILQQNNATTGIFGENLTPRDISLSEAKSTTSLPPLNQQRYSILKKKKSHEAILKTESTIDQSDNMFSLSQITKVKSQQSLKNSSRITDSSEIYRMNNDQQPTEKNQRKKSRYSQSLRKKDVIQSNSKKKNYQIQNLEDKTGNTRNPSIELPLIKRQHLPNYSKVDEISSAQNYRPYNNATPRLDMEYSHSSIEEQENALNIQVENLSMPHEDLTNREQGQQQYSNQFNNQQHQQQEILNVSSSESNARSFLTPQGKKMINKQTFISPSSFARRSSYFNPKLNRLKLKAITQDNDSNLQIQSPRIKTMRENNSKRLSPIREKNSRFNTSNNNASMFNSSYEQYEYHPKNDQFWTQVSQIRENCFKEGSNSSNLQYQISKLDSVMDKYRKRSDKSDLASLVNALNQEKKKTMIEQMKQNLEMNREIRQKFDHNQNLLKRVEQKKTELQQIIDLQKKTKMSPLKSKEITEQTPNSPLKNMPNNQQQGPVTNF